MSKIHHTRIHSSKTMYTSSPTKVVTPHRPLPPKPSNPLTNPASSNQPFHLHPPYNLVPIPTRTNRRCSPQKKNQNKTRIKPKQNKSNQIKLNPLPPSLPYTARKRSNRPDSLQKKIPAVKVTSSRADPPEHNKGHDCSESHSGFLRSLRMALARCPYPPPPPPLQAYGRTGTKEGGEGKGREGKGKRGCFPFWLKPHRGGSWLD